MTFLALYYVLKPSKSLMATYLRVVLFYALTTVPKDPWPIIEISL